MNLDRVSKIAEAVLYEGYMLYPYRASAVKNQQRWNFGVLCPRSYSEAQKGTEAWAMQTECLLQGDASTQVDVRVRFLQIVERAIGKFAHPLPPFPDGRLPELDAEFESVERLEAGQRTFIPWQEAMEREVTIPLVRLASDASPLHIDFEFPAATEREAIPDEGGSAVGVIVRERESLTGSVEIAWEPRGEGVFKLNVAIRNLGTNEQQLHTDAPQLRSDALLYSFISTHTVLATEKGEFVSLLDPPENLRELAAECRNQGTWPVLVGEEGDREMMLSSPIILYDYPQIAPESPGSLFDGTEIDEILSLRILTLTEEEKREMRQSDERARQILDRTENMPPEQFMKLHGVLRSLRPFAGEAQ